MSKAKAGPQSLYRWCFGAAEFDEAARHLSIAGVKLHLEPKPAQILELLLRHAGEVVTQAELRESVWGNRLTVDHVLATAVGKLRLALKDVPEVSIITAARVGYKLVGHVSRVLVRGEFVGQFELSIGDDVPLRSGFELVESLANSRGSEVWLARHRRSGESRVYKFASDGERLASLKQEVTLSQVLQEGLGPRADFTQVLSWNFADAPYFLESAYAGQSLRKWAQTHLDALDAEQRLGIFLQVAQAVAAAHSVGVLHKDIKPENVLVVAGDAGHWQVRLADFGVGRILHEAQPSESERTELDSSVSIAPGMGSPSGTLFYLAPEVIAGKSPSIRSDVYALGVLLYQCVVADLVRPLASGWQRDVDDELLIEDIAAATDLDPERRTASASQLVEQLLERQQRRLDRHHRRENAQRLLLSETALQRARARRPWMLTALAALGLAFGLSFWLYFEAETGRRAAQRYGDSAAAVQRFLAEDLLGQANPVDSRFDYKAGLVRMLDNAAKGIDLRFANEPLTLAVLNRVIGGAYRSLGNRERSIEHLRTAVTIFSQQQGANHELTLEAHYALVHALALASEFMQANAELIAADRLATDRLTTPSTTALESAIAWALLKTLQFAPAEALPAYERAIKLMEQGVPIDPAQSAVIRVGATDALIRTGQIDRALELLKVLQTDIHVPAGNEWEIPRLFARALVLRENYSDALPYAQAALKLSRDHYGPNHWNSIVALSSLSNVQFELKDCPSSLESAIQAYQLMRDNEGPDRQGTLTEQGNLGARQFDCGHRDEGLQNLYAARDGLRRNFGPANPVAQSFGFFLAGYLGEAKRYTEALQAIESLSQDAVESIRAGGATNISPAKLQLLHATLLLRNGEGTKAAGVLAPVLTELRGDSEQADLLDEAIVLQREICTAEPSAQCPASTPDVTPEPDARQP